MLYNMKNKIEKQLKALEKNGDVYIINDPKKEFLVQPELYNFTRDTDFISSTIMAKSESEAADHTLNFCKSIGVLPYGYYVRATLMEYPYGLLKLKLCVVKKSNKETV